MTDAPPDMPDHPPIRLAARPFSRPAASAARPTPLATRSVLFVPRETEELPDPTPEPPAPPEAVVSEPVPAPVPAPVSGPRWEGSGGHVFELVRDDEVGDDSSEGATDADWGAAADYPVDDFGFPAVPPGYEYALDESPREPLSDGRAGSVDVATPESGESGGGGIAPEAATPPDAARERAARTLEVLAERVRRGRIVLPDALAAGGGEAALLAGLLTTLLVGEPAGEGERGAIRAPGPQG